MRRKRLDFRYGLWFTFAAMVTFGSPALPWEVVREWRDPINGRVYVAATDTNSDGYSIAIFRDIDDRVRAVYAIPSKSFDRVPFEGRVLSVRPDENSVVDVVASLALDSVVEYAKSDGRNIRSLIWHGEGESPLRGTLRDILDSDILSARFYTDTSGTIDTTWSLDGAPSSISQALEISVVADPEQKEWDALQTELLIGATQRCEGDMACIGRVTPCFDLIIDSKKVDEFKNCVARAAP